MSAPDYNAKLAKLLEKLASKHADAAAIPYQVQPILDGDQPTLNEFLWSFLLWESTPAQARAAADRLVKHVVDFNDLRVCVPEELVDILGDRSPVAVERAERLRASMSDIFKRTHTVSLEHVTKLSKKEARTQLESLEGAPTYVSARVSLLLLGVHAMPMDRRMLSRLVSGGTVEPGTTVDEASDLIQRKVRAGELLPVYLGLQAMSDEAVEVEEKPKAAGSKGSGKSR